jgi:vitamin B12 transporter
MFKKSTTLYAFLTAFSTIASANETAPRKLEDMVVTAHLVPVEKSRIGSSATVITAKEIEQQQITYVSDILRTVPGLAVNQSGGSFGAFTQVRIRGAEANHTLVRLDGIEINDPSGGSEYNFGNMLASNIERIEIIRGAQSALYGSDAIGGVINIITKKGSQGLQVNGFAEGGSFETYKTGGGISGGWKDLVDFSVNATQFESKGVSAAESGTERDANRNLTLDGSLNVRPLTNLEFGVSGRLVRANTEFDAFRGGVGGLDGDRETSVRQTYGRTFTKLTLFEETDWINWEHLLSTSYSESKRDNFSDKKLSSEFDGRKTKYAYQTNLSVDTPDLFQSNHTLTFLVEYEKDHVSATSPFIKVNRSLDTTSYVGEYQLGLFDRFFISGSIRHDDNEDLFGDYTTYHATLAYLLKETDTRFHASYGTGVKNPTNFELFGFSENFQGNPNLKPEESLSWDLGIEQNFFDGRIGLDVTYYNNRIENPIVGSGKTAINVKDGRTRTEGVEVTFHAKIMDDLDFNSSYTWSGTEDNKGRRLVRRPEHIASANLNYNFEVFGNRGNVNIGVKYNGKQTDFAFDRFFNRSIVELEDYALLNIAASYQIYDQVEIFARVENLLDEDYQEVYTFASKGIAGYGGIRINLGPYFK